MESLLQPKFGKALPPVPSPTKMRVRLSDEGPEYSRFLGRDPEAMLSVAKQKIPKVTAPPATKKPLSLKEFRQWFPLAGLLMAITVMGFLLITAPRSQTEEGSSPAPFYWDGLGSPLGRIA